MFGITVSLSGRGRISATRADGPTSAQLARDIEQLLGRRMRAIDLSWFAAHGSEGQAAKARRMAETLVFSGTVEWSGENPGISLKETPDGPFTTLASFFRVVLSPHGRGHALVLMLSPQEAAPAADRANLCLTDNEPLARWLVSDYVAHFGAWRGLPGLQGLEYRSLDSVTSGGDAISRYSETVRAGDLNVVLQWSGLGKPFCFALPPEQSATGRHHMPSLFVGCDAATVTVNERRRPGAPVPREIAGHRISTAMLAFSETWIRV